MKLKLQLVTLSDGGEELDAVDIATLDKGCERLEQIGLTLAESKQILKETQRHVVSRQVTAFVEARAQCACGKRRGNKGHHTLVFRTLFGNVSIKSPRLRRCSCRNSGNASFSPAAELFTEHASPELRFMEARWASLVSYGMTVKESSSNPGVARPELGREVLGAIAEGFRPARRSAPYRALSFATRPPGCCCSPRGRNTGRLAGDPVPLCVSPGARRSPRPLPRLFTAALAGLRSSIAHVD